MSKLLSANLLRIKKDKIFWIAMLFMFAAGIYFPVMNYIDMKHSEYIVTIENGFFANAIFISIISAVFCSLFVGTEYSDGTIRNKIAVGQKRSSIYLANLITCSIAGFVMCTVFWILYLCVGIPLLGFFTVDMKYILLFALTTFALSVSFVSIFTMIAMLNQNKAIVSVICLLITFFLLIGGTYINAKLNAPKTYPAYIFGNEDTEAEDVPNPSYLEGAEREAHQFLYDFFPGGQAVQCSTLEAVNPYRLPVYSLIIIVVTTGAGLVFFRKKDLK